MNLFCLNLLVNERIVLLFLRRKSYLCPLSLLNEDYVWPSRMTQVDKPWMELQGVREEPHTKGIARSADRRGKEVVFVGGHWIKKKAEILNQLTVLSIMMCSFLSFKFFIHYTHQPQFPLYPLLPLPLPPLNPPIHSLERVMPPMGSQLNLAH